jgi:hypothetical protein
MLRGVRELALRPPGNLIHKVPNPARKGNMRAKDQWIPTSLEREVFSFYDPWIERRLPPIGSAKEAYRAAVGPRLHAKSLPNRMIVKMAPQSIKGDYPYE